MAAENKIQYPQTDRWAFLWLALGALLLTLSTGQFRVALAAWVAPLFLIRFFRSQRAGRGYLILLPVLYISYAFSWQNILSFAFPLLIFLIFNIFVTLLNSLPFLADRLLATRIPGFTATLIYPLTVTATFYFYNLFSPLGSFGTPGYEQYTNLALLQILSVTGMWGLILLVHWFGPVVNWAWERAFHWTQIRTGFSIWAAVIMAVFLFGGLRLALAQSPSSTVRVHSFSARMDQLNDLPDVNTDLDGFRRTTQAINEKLIAGTLREAEKGAQIVLWSEMAGGGVEEDAKALIARAQEVAKQENIYLAMGLQIHYPDQDRPWENKAMVIAPSGDILLDHDKFGALFMYSMAGEGQVLQGKYALQTAQTPLGALTGAVCWDADFPMTMKQAGQNHSSLILVPAGDPGGATGVLHAQQSVFRAIENGASLIRHTYNEGISLAADPYGRIVGMVDISTASEPVLAAQVPTQGVFAIYPIIGDVFAWLSIAGLLSLIAWAVIFGRR